jgi:transposase
VQRYVAGWQRAAPPPSRPEVPGSRTLAWLLLRRRSELEDAHRTLLQRLCRDDQEVAAARHLAQQFLVLGRQRRGGNRAGWVTAAHATGPPELRGFARNLRRDWAAVQAGLTLEWSSGPVEGHVNRLKLIKRQMYGRGRFELLRRRVLLDC